MHGHMKVETYNDISTRKKKTRFTVAFCTVTSSSCYWSLRGTCHCSVATHLSQPTVSTLKHPQPLTSPLRELGPSHTHFCCSPILSTCNVSLAVSSGESYPVHKYFLWLRSLILTGYPPPRFFIFFLSSLSLSFSSTVSLFSFSLLCLYLSLPLTPHPVECKI